MPDDAVPSPKVLALRVAPVIVMPPAPPVVRALARSLALVSFAVVMVPAALARTNATGYKNESRREGKR